MDRFPTAVRRLAGSLAIALLVLATLGCTVGVGWTATSSRPVSGETPARFATVCSDIGGTLAESDTQDGGAKSSCAMPNGDTKTCDWQEQRCTAVCHSSEAQCAVVRDLAWVPPWQHTGTPKAPDVSTPIAPLTRSDMTTVMAEAE